MSKYEALYHEQFEDIKLIFDKVAIFVGLNIKFISIFILSILVILVILAAKPNWSLTRLGSLQLLTLLQNLGLVCAWLLVAPLCAALVAAPYRAQLSRPNGSSARAPARMHRPWPYCRWLQAQLQHLTCPSNTCAAA